MSQPDEEREHSLIPLLDRFMEVVIFEAGLSERTLSAYAADIRAYLLDLEVGGIDAPADILREDITDHVGGLLAGGMSPRSVTRHLSAIRRFHRFLRDENLVPLDPAADLDAPKLRRALPRLLSSEEIERLLNAPDLAIPEGVRDAAILELFYACGLRISELAKLPLREVSLEESHIRVRGKGAKVRLVPLGGRAIERLRAWLPIRNRGEVHDDTLFLSSRGRASAVPASGRS